jgi:hypothetical protein
VIAGENHPLTPGYTESLRKRYEGHPNIEITGYVPEESIPDLFSRASVLVMPYTSATGSSGVAHQACQFGLPIVCADLSDFRDMAEEEGLGIEFYRIGDRPHLAETIVRLLNNPERQYEMADQNYAVAVRHTMPQIVRQYLRHFEWELNRRQPKTVWRLRARRGMAFAPHISPAWCNAVRTLQMTVPAAAHIANTLNIPQAVRPDLLDTCSTLPSQTAQIFQIEEQDQAKTWRRKAG